MLCEDSTCYSVMCNVCMLCEDSTCYSVMCNVCMSFLTWPLLNNKGFISTCLYIYFQTDNVINSLAGQRNVVSVACRLVTRNVL